MQASPIPHCPTQPHTSVQPQTQSFASLDLAQDTSSFDHNIQPTLTYSGTNVLPIFSQIPISVLPQPETPFFSSLPCDEHHILDQVAPLAPVAPSPPPHPNPLHTYPMVTCSQDGSRLPKIPKSFLASKHSLPIALLASVSEKSEPSCFS